MTSPLVPVEVDLRDFAFMPVDVVRLRDSDLVTKATGDQFRCAVMLWCASWHQVPAASLPDDDEVLAQLAGIGRVVKEWRKVREGSLRGWIQCDDGRLYHPFIAKKALIAWEKKCATGRKVDRRLEIESGEWALIRASVFERDDWTCRYCGARGVKLEADHVVPARFGGATSMENLVTACRPCNRSKGTRALGDWLSTRARTVQ